MNTLHYLFNLNPINMATRITLIYMFTFLYLPLVIYSSPPITPLPPPHTLLILLLFTYYGRTRCFIIGLAVTLTFIDLIINVLLFY